MKPIEQMTEDEKDRELRLRRVYDRDVLQPGLIELGERVEQLEQMAGIRYMEEHNDSGR